MNMCHQTILSLFKACLAFQSALNGLQRSYVPCACPAYCQRMPCLTGTKNIQ